MNYLDLKEARPLVVAAPPDVIGMFTDFFQRTITDVGAIGPDRVRGGLYLLLPPDYDGQVPKGYFEFKSPTYNVFLIFRTVMEKGADGPDPAPAVALAEHLRHELLSGLTIPPTVVMPSINGFNKVAMDTDGSVDLWFGPEKPADVAASNWIQTVSGHDFLVALRLYGTEAAFFDQTWKPDDVVKVR